MVFLKYLIIIFVLSIAKVHAGNNAKRQLNYPDYTTIKNAPSAETQYNYGNIDDPGHTKQADSNTPPQSDTQQQIKSNNVPQSKQIPLHFYNFNSIQDNYNTKDHFKPLYHLYYGPLPQQEQQQQQKPQQNVQTSDKDIRTIATPSSPHARSAYTHYFTANTPSQHHHHYQAQYTPNLPYHQHQLAQQQYIKSPLLYVNGASQHTINKGPQQVHNQQQQQNDNYAEQQQQHLTPFSPQSLANLANYGPHPFPIDANNNSPQGNTHPSSPSASQVYHNPYINSGPVPVSPQHFAVAQYHGNPSSYASHFRYNIQPFPLTGHSLALTNNHQHSTAAATPQQQPQQQLQLHQHKDFFMPSPLPANAGHHFQLPFRSSPFVGYMHEQQHAATQQSNLQPSAASPHNYHAHPTKPVQEPSTENSRYKRNANQRFVYLSPNHAYDLYKY